MNLLLENPLYRKALIYAFQLTTPSQQVLSKDFIHRQLHQTKVYEEFLQALQLVNMYYKPSPPLEERTWQQWLTDANDEVVSFLMDYCQPYIAQGKCSRSEVAEAIFDLLPPLLKIEKHSMEEPMSY